MDGMRVLFLAGELMVRSKVILELLRNRGSKAIHPLSEAEPELVDEVRRFIMGRTRDDDSLDEDARRDHSHSDKPVKDKQKPFPQRLRVLNLARELNMGGRQLVKSLQSAGIEVKSPTSVLNLGEGFASFTV